MPRTNQRAEEDEGKANEVQPQSLAFQLRERLTAVNAFNTSRRVSNGINTLIAMPFVDSNIAIRLRAQCRAADSGVPQDEAKYV